MIIPLLFGGQSKFIIDANTNVIIDGNSIYTWVGGDAMDVVLSRLPPFFESGCTFHNLAISGATWTTMRAGASDVDDAYVPGMKNILIAGETTNEALATEKTGQEIWNVAADYFQARKTAHPDLKMLVCGSIPFWRELTDNAERNQRMIDFDTIMKANYSGLVDGYVDYRTDANPQFNHDGSLITYFSAYPTLWADYYLHPSTAGKDTMGLSICSAVSSLKR